MTMQEHIYTALYSRQSIWYDVVLALDMGNQNVVLLKLKAPSCQALVFVCHSVKKGQRIVICEDKDWMNCHIEVYIKMLQR